MYKPEFADTKAIRRELAEYVKPPRRISVSAAVSETLHVGTGRRWDIDITPYMREILDTVSSRRYEAVVFAKPARCGGTKALIDGTLTYHVTCDPARCLIYFPTEKNAADYSKTELEVAHQASPGLRAALSPRARDNVILTRVYRSGMVVNMLWPTTANLAQRTARVVALSDYDSMADNIDGGDSAFDSGKKRVQVAMSAGMVIAESNPKRVITEAAWRPSTPHEAPPTDGGIMALYNRGDRRCWYWRCIHCGEYFRCPPLPDYEKHDDIESAAASAHVACVHCGGVHTQDHKRKLNLSGIWVPDGCKPRPDGTLEGTPIASATASFWLVGCAAGFQTWKQLVREYLTGLRELEETGNEAKLKNTTNSDQGLPYLPRRLIDDRDPDFLNARIERAERGAVHRDVRVLFAAVDVQGNRFEIGVWGYGPGRERWLVDRYAITHDAEGEKLNPPVYSEHWDELDALLDASYDGLFVHRVVVDSGGFQDKKGGARSTRRAYEWWRRLRARNQAYRVLLCRGQTTAAAAAVRIGYPDSSGRSDRRSGARGDIPVLQYNGNKLKDAAFLDLQREQPGPGYIHLPDWLSPEYFAELSAERAGPKGWELLPGKRRNETWDLLIEADAVWTLLGGDNVDWDRPPAWLVREKPQPPQPQQPPQSRQTQRPMQRQGRPRGGFVTGWR